MPLIELPEGKGYLRVPEGLTDEQALSLARQKFPFLYDKRGIASRAGTAALEGVKQLGESASGIGAGIQSLFGGRQSVQRYIEEQRRDQEEEAKKPRSISLQNLIDQYKTEGLLPALSNVPAYVTEQVLQNAPSMAVPLGAGAAATAYSAPFLGPAAPLAGLAAGIGAYGAQTFGSNIQRQALTEGRTAETMEPGKALGAAAVAAPIGFIVDRWTLGLGKVPTQTALSLIQKEIAARGVGKTLAVGAAKGLLEVPTEVLETALERGQAGLSLTDKEARAEYLETAASAAAVGTVGGAGFAYKGRADAQKEIAAAEEEQRMRERVAQRTADLEQERQKQAEQDAYKASPAYSANLFQERYPLVERVKEINNILRVGGKDLDPDDKKALEKERKDAGIRITAINKALKEIGAVPPPATGKKSALQIQAELKAQQELVDEEGNVLKTPQQAQEEYEASQEEFYRQQEAARKLFENEEKVRAQESEYFQPDMFEGKQKKDPFVRGQRELTESIEASRQAQIAKARAAAEKEAKERGLIVDDYGNIVSGKEAQRLGLDIAAAERARQEKFAPSYEVTPEQIEPATPEEVEKYKAEGAAALAPEVKEAQKPKVQQDIDTGYLTPEVQKHLGISLRSGKEEGGAKATGPAAALQKATGVAPKPAFKGYNLNQFDQAQEALPAIQERIRQLSAESRDVAQSGEPVENGKITGLGKKLLDIEGKIKELERLQKVAQDAPVQEADFNFQTAQKRVAALKEERSSLEALFDPLERLRMGETQEGGAEGKRSVLGTRTKFVEQAKDAATGYENAAVEEANLQRQLNGGSALPKEEESKLREIVRGLFNKALSSAAGPLEKNRQMSARIEKFLEKVKDPAARKALLDAQSLFDQNKTSREPKKNALSLTNATENILKNGVNPKTVVVLREAVQATAAYTGKQTDYGPALANIEKQLETLLGKDSLRDLRLELEAERAGKKKQILPHIVEASKDPKVQALLRSYRNLFEKQKAATPTAGRGVSGSERKQIMTALNKAIAQAAEVPKGEVKKGPFGLVPAGEKRQAFKEAEAKGEEEVSLGMSPESELAFVQQSIRKLIELGAKRSEVGPLIELLSSKFKTARVGETAKERQLTKEEINKRLAELSALEGKLLDRAGAGELPRFRGYLVGKINEALRIPGLDEKTVAALQEAKDWFTAGRGARGVKETRTGEVVLRNTTQKVAYETTTRGSLEAANDLVNDLTMGRTADTKDLVDALKLEKNVVQEMEAQRDLFVEPGREEKTKTPAGQPPIFTAVKRASAENFQKFQDALKKRFETLRQKYESDADAEVFKRIDRTDLANLRRDIVALKEALSKSPYANLDATINKLKDSLNSDLDARLTRVAKSGLDPVKETGFVNALEARRIKFEALKEARAELGESGVINDAVEFADALDKNLQALLVPLAKRYEARRFDQSISNMSGLEKKLLDMLKTAEILRATRKFKFVIGETTAFDAEVTKQTVQIKDLLSKMASRRAAMEVAQRREAIAAEKAEKEAKRSKVESEMKARGIVRTLEGERTGEGIRTEEEIRSAAELAAEERKATAARGATSRVNLLTKTFANLGREIDFISRGGVAGYNKALKETRASFAESGVPEDSDAFQSALLKRLKENKKTVTLTEEDKKALRKLRSKRTRVGNELSDLIERSVEAEISFDRATFQDLENELKSIESKLKYEKITPQQEKLLAKDRQEIRGILGAYRTGLVAGQAAEPRAKKSRAEKLADAAARRALTKEGGAKTISAVEESDLEDLASFEEGEIPISAGRSPISESRGTVTTENPSDKSTVYKELDRAFKGKNSKDRVTVYDTVAEARAAHPDYADEMHKNTRGFTIGDKTFLVAENINKGKALSVLLHELGVHVGFRNFFSPKEFNALVNVVKSWAGRKDNSLEAQVGRAAMERVEAAGTKGEQINDEILAYAVEEAVDAGLDPAGLKGGSPVRNWFNRIVQAFKSALNKLGLAPDTLTAQNLVDFAYGTANMEMGRAAAPTGAAKDILFSRAKEKMPAGFEAVEDFSKAAIAKSKSFLTSIKGRTLEQNALAFKVTALDRLAAIEEIAEKEAKAGNSNEAMQMMYFLQKQLDMLSNASASAYTGALNLVEDKGQFYIEAKEGASLRSTDAALKPLLKMGFNAEGAENLFTAYMASLRGKQEGYQKLNFSPEVIELAQKVLPAIEARQDVKDVLDAARAEYNEYNKGMIRFAEKTGAITPELAKELNAKKDYIPYYRDVGGVLTMFIGSGAPVKIGDLKNQPHLQKLVGGDDKIMSYFESSMKNTLVLTDLSLRNIAVKNTAHAFRTFGLLEAHKGRDGKEHYIRTGDGPANENVLRFKDKGEDRHVVVNTTGTPYEYIPTELLVKGMEGTAIVMPEAVKLLSIPGQILRKGITLNPLYPYYQLVKDSMSMGATKGVSGSNTANTLNGIKKYINGDALIKELQAKGVISERELFTGTLDDVARIRRRILEGTGKLQKFVAAQEARAVRADGAVRAMLYEKYLKEGLSQRDAEYMTVKAMPYNRRGLDPTLRYLSQMVPFFNAQIVGLYSLYQSFRGQGPMADKLQIKKKLYTAGMGMAVGTLAYAALVDGEDWYENMPLETRLRNWLIKVPGLDEPVAVPIPFEFGIIFKSFFEATYLGMFKDTPEGKKVRDAFRKLVLSSVPGGTIPVEAVPVAGALPLPIPTFAQPLISVAVNKDLFSGNPIEGERELGVEPAERFRDTTSETAKSLGRMADVSPLQIDHLIRGYTGTLGPAVIALIDAFTGPANPAAGVKPDAPLSKTPLFGQIFKPVDGGALIDQAVTSLKEADQARRTYQKLASDGRTEEAEAFLEKKQDLIERGNLAGKLRQRLGEYARIERAIKAYPASEMSPYEKREALEDLRRAKIQESKEFMQAFRTGV